MTEFLLQYLWNYKLFNTASFKDLDGKSIEILDFGIVGNILGSDISGFVHFSELAWNKGA